MSSINLTGNETGNKRRRTGVKRMIKHNLRVDMTPMVDLGFLLITFFVITTELAKPTTMNLVMPKDGPSSELASSNALTILLYNDNIYYYHGDWKEAVKTGSITAIHLSGEANLRKVIGEKQRKAAILNLHNEGRDGVMVLIKPSGGSSYKKMVDVLDEMLINRVKKYAIVKLADEEMKWLKEKEE